MAVLGKLKNVFNAFRNRAPTSSLELGVPTYRRPDRSRNVGYSVSSIVIPIFNRLALDSAMIDIKHALIDENGKYVRTIDGPLNEALSTEANVDQTGRAMLFDAYMTMFQEGYVALVPVECDKDPHATDSFKVETIRVGRIKQWMPRHVICEVYDQDTGMMTDLTCEKRTTVIIENPFYSIMNEPTSALQRLIKKLSMLDDSDDRANSNRLDLIFQLPYAIKSDARKELANDRRKTIEDQLINNPYGIAYIDSTEHIIQLNRPLENNLLKQVESLKAEVYNHFGLTEAVFNGTADEQQMINYYNQSIQPVLVAVAEETRRKWLSKTARTQGQSIYFNRDPFKLVPVSSIAELADKFTRNEILSSNEVRSLIGFRPVDDPSADELRNANLNRTEGQKFASTREGEGDVYAEDDKVIYDT